MRIKHYAFHLVSVPPPPPPFTYTIDVVCSDIETKRRFMTRKCHSSLEVTEVAC
jgi:hypothetical protein